jgi:NAD(P)-dependent dehydrogenase (short-subunit alcohol dehydrogenase family)
LNLDLPRESATPATSSKELQMRFKNKVVIITGAASGMGLAAAELFAREGALVGVNDLLDDPTRTTVAAIKAQGGSAFAIPGDASNQDFIERTVKAIVEEHGRIDVLASNAGVASIKPAIEYSHWDKMIAINLSAHFHWARAVAAYSMIPNKGGVIVNTASIAGHMAYPGDIGYVAAKAGLIGLTRGLAIEWAPHGIRVNCVCPGLTESPMVREVERIDPERFRIRRQRVPMGRAAQPVEIADAIAYLASESASYITGAALNVDGGQVAMSSGFSPA